MTNPSAPRRAARSQAHRYGPRRVRVGRLVALGVVGLVGIAALGAALGVGRSDSAVPSSVAIASAEPSIPPSGGLPSPSASPSPTTLGTPGTIAPVLATTNLYAAAGVGMFSATVARFPPRVYVPDEANGTVIVIDPTTFKILVRYRVGASPEHVTPDWDLQRLYVEIALGGRLAVIDPKTGRPKGQHAVPGPYNLYFTLDGRMAIVVLDSRISGGEYGPGADQLYFYDRRTWRLIRALRLPWAGADHLDFSADGSYFLLSTEYSGFVVKVDVKRMAVVNALFVGGQPVDIRLAPDGRVFYAANQGLNGAAILDPVHLRQIKFLSTGRGAHGLAVSRDARWLYVTNRLAGTLSVIDFASRTVVHTWHIGGTPDMIAVSPDGTQLWISNRYSGTVSVINAHSGRVIRLIWVGGHPHGLAYFPEPGRLSLGHNGIYR